MGIINIFGKKVEYRITKKGCWIVTSHKPNTDGYVRLCFRENGKNKFYFVHRLMYCQEHGINIEDLKDCVCHRCDNPPCIRPKHLWNGTKNDNNKDRDLKGRHGNMKGELNPSAKLTKIDVLDIKVKKGIVLQKDLAKQYGVNYWTIWNIQNNKTWKHL